MKCRPGGIIFTPLNFSPVLQELKSIPNSDPKGTSRKNNVAPSSNNFKAMPGSIS